MSVYQPQYNEILLLLQNKTKEINRNYCDQQLSKLRKSHVAHIVSAALKWHAAWQNGEADLWAAGGLAGGTFQDVCPDLRSAVPSPKNSTVAALCALKHTALTLF